MSSDSEGSGRSPVPITFAGRKKVIDALCEAYARDQLTVEELEERLDRANRVRTQADLDALLEHLDLSGWRSEFDSAGLPVSVGGGGGLAEAQIPDRRLVLAVWTGANRRGRWVPPRRLTATALQGQIGLDFREAVLAAGPYELRVTAVMGGVHIVVPPGLAVETSGFALVGGFHGAPEGTPPPASDGPVLRIRGLAVLGSVHVDVRLPGESATEAKRRRRREPRKDR